MPAVKWQIPPQSFTVEAHAIAVIAADADSDDTFSALLMASYAGQPPGARLLLGSPSI